MKHALHRMLLLTLGHLLHPTLGWPKDCRPADGHARQGGQRCEKLKIANGIQELTDRQASPLRFLFWMQIRGLVQ